MSEFDVKAAEFITKVEKITPGWVKDILLKPYREAIEEHLRNLEFYNIEEIDIPPKTLETAKTMTESKSDWKNRERLSQENGTGAIVQGFGNGVSYIHTYEYESRKIDKMYYLDFQTGKAVDIRSIDPTIKCFNGMIDKDTGRPAPSWYALSHSRQVFISPYDSPPGFGQDQEIFEKTNLVAPAHEFGHVIERDTEKKQPRLEGLPRHLFKWSEQYQSLIADLHRITLMKDDSNPDDKELAEAFLKDHRMNEKGSSSERYASLFALLFARSCRKNGVDIYRGMKQTEIIGFANECLHDDSIL